MTSRQHSKQSDIAVALTNPGQGVPDDLVSPDGSPATHRFDVYRNNVIVGLTDVLAGAFPVTQRLVGEEFFDAMAGVYIRQHPARSPILSRFGETFPDFIAEFPPAASVPYLGDIARLERARRRAYHAKDARPAKMDELAAIDEARLPDLMLALHPSAYIVRSPYPIVSIWLDNIVEDEQSARTLNNRESLERLGRNGIDLDSAEDALVCRPDLTVGIYRLPSGCAAFATTLGEGEPLGIAAATATNEVADAGGRFDLPLALQTLIMSGSLSGLIPGKT